MKYTPNPARYADMPYRRCGKSGLKLPAMSLGLWHSFGAQASYDNCCEMVLGAFDSGITHFDLANNYGPPEGSAEETLGKILNEQLSAHRDEMVISTKAGYYMWEGPYGEWGSRKHLISSLDQSLKRLGLDYVDIFYHHRPDPETPLEETADALADIVKSGKAMYAGISNYNEADTQRIVDILSQRGVHCLIHQMKYSMLHRQNEPIFALLNKNGVGSIAFSPLAQGILTGKYANGIPSNSRAATDKRFLNASSIDENDVEKANKLMPIAESRGQSLAQMALAWVLRDGAATSVILGASKLSQITDNLNALKNLTFTSQELAKIDDILR